MFKMMMAVVAFLAMSMVSAMAGGPDYWTKQPQPVKPTWVMSGLNSQLVDLPWSPLTLEESVEKPKSCPNYGVTSSLAAWMDKAAMLADTVRDGNMTDPGTRIRIQAAYLRLNNQYAAFDEKMKRCFRGDADAVAFKRAKMWLEDAMDKVPSTDTATDDDDVYCQDPAHAPTCGG